MEKYFGMKFEDIRKDPELKLLYPLAWFRCCTGILRKDRWPKEIQDRILDVFYNEFLPFIKKADF